MRSQMFLHVYLNGVGKYTIELCYYNYVPTHADLRDSVMIRMKEGNCIETVLINVWVCSGQNNK